MKRNEGKNEWNTENKNTSNKTEIKSAMKTRIEWQTENGNEVDCIVWQRCIVHSIEMISWNIFHRENSKRTKRRNWIRIEIEKQLNSKSHAELFNEFFVPNFGLVIWLVHSGDGTAKQIQTVLIYMFDCVFCIVCMRSFWEIVFFHCVHCVYKTEIFDK